MSTIINAPITIDAITISAPVSLGAVGATGKSQYQSYLDTTDDDPVLSEAAWSAATEGGGGVTDHGALGGLGDDDHPQYHNDERGDARYATTTALAGKASLTDANNFTGTQSFAEPVYLSGAVMGVITSPIAGAYNGPGTGLTGNAANLSVGGASSAGYATTAGTANALAGILPITNGGTGATTESAARTALGLGSTNIAALANIALNSGTITGSSPLVFNQTWNNAATTFTGIQSNITDTASNAASLLMDLQVGGVSKFTVHKGGAVTGTIVIASDSFTLSGYQFYVRGSTGAAIGSNLPFGWSSGTNNAHTGSTTQLWRDDNHIIAQRNGTAAQTFRLYDTFASASDYHRIAIATARATATAMSGATITLANIIPAGAVVVGITCKVTTAITGATSFDLGTAPDADRFGAGIAVAVGTTSDNRDWTSGTVECFPSNTSLILTANGGNFATGAVYVSVQYLSGQSD